MRQGNASHILRNAPVHRTLLPRERPLSRGINAIRSLLQTKVVTVGSDLRLISGTTQFSSGHIRSLVDKSRDVAVDGWWLSDPIMQMRPLTSAPRRFRARKDKEIGSYRRCQADCEMMDCSFSSTATSTADQESNIIVAATRVSSSDPASHLDAEILEDEFLVELA